MEDKTKVLKEDWGIDLTCFYEAHKNKLLRQRLKESEYYSDVVLEAWSKEDKVKFSNTVFNIVSKY